MQRRMIAFAGIVALLATMVAPAAAGAITFDQEPFHDTWTRTDGPVAEGQVARTWMWGPGPISAGMDEVYAEAPGGERRVQYFDKSRMEITHPDGDPTDPWYVTNGLLVVEMITGEMQLGDATFEQHEPATQNVAGDQTDNELSPAYDDLNGLLDEPAAEIGDAVIDRYTPDGQPVADESYLDEGVTAAHYVEATDHTVASPFWDFMNSEGLISDGAQTFTGPLFPNPFYATGLPITEAYWTTIPVAGEMTDVLFQCFERRCLTYTPSNEAGWQVEAGNVGQHYMAWRYGDEAPATEQAQIFLVAIGDQGASGEAFGCDDSLVPVTVDIDTSRGEIIGALEALLAIDTPQYGESGLSTALHNWNVTVDSAEVENGVATVQMSGDISIGGVCDEPRIEYQLERTVLQFPNVDEVEIFINGESLESILSSGEPPATEQAQIFLVAIGDQGASGEAFGCDDSLVPVTVDIDTSRGPIIGALEALLAIDTPDYGESGLHNSLHAWDVTVDSIDVADGVATVELSGEIAIAGVCQHPRIEYQLERTVEQFPEVDEAEIYINGERLEDILSLQ